MIDEADLRDLKERVELIETMADTPGWTMLVDRATATLGVRQKRVMTGKIDFNDYQQECAFIDGALFVLNLPHKVREELDNALIQQAEFEEMEADAVS